MNLEILRNKIKNNFLGYFFLFMLSIIYFLIVFIKRKLYDYNFLKSYKANTKVICIGNLTSGGTGKTSLIITLAKELSNKKIKIAIITRGYKRSKKTKETIIISKENIPSIDYTGDEALLIFKELEKYDIPILINSNRVNSINLAIEKFKPDLILMDDGFSNLKIKKDLNVLIFNASIDIDKERILPLGNLRENLSVISKADLAILSHCEVAKEENIKNLENKIKRINPNIKILKGKHLPDFFYDPLNNKNLDLNYFKNKNVSIFSALGDNKSFENELRLIPLNPLKIWTFKDHYSFSLKDLMSISNISDTLPIITTFKDFIKFPKNFKSIFNNNLYIFSIKFELEKKDEILDLIIKK